MNLISFLINKPKIYRKICLILLDVFVINVSFLGSFLLFSPENNLKNIINDYIIYSFIFAFFGVVIYLITGQYKGITRYIGSTNLYFQSGRNFLLILSILIYTRINPLSDLSIKFLIVFYIILTCLGGFFRFLIRDILFLIYYDANNKLDQPRVVIYGAGKAGIKLYNALRYTNKKKVVAFIDDSKELANRKINNINIFSPDKISFLAPNIDEILLAIPSANKEKIREILQLLENFAVKVLKVPPIEDIVSGQIKIDNTIPITMEDLLGRKLIKPQYNLMRDAIKDKSVCITGAGGSIGSELVMQILKLKPKQIILYDNNELNLYTLSTKVDNLKTSIPYKFVLADATDFEYLKKIFLKYSINTVFHAAAYKHVPLVEENPQQGIYNNVFSTFYICKAAEYCGVEKVTLISTDKAVRPTNVMGASKRLAELIVMEFSKKQNDRPNKSQDNSKTIFSMVRFGNVLGSSGSVVPKFQEQIIKGESITLTHPDIVRYFMSISEAVQLVIQSSSISLGGEVFLLDMGEPILIKDIAIKLIKFSGKTLKNKDNPQGDIEIKITGLRHGEKLNEELLVDSEASSTEHHLIYKAKENVNLNYDFWEKLELLKDEIKKNNPKEIIYLLSVFVPEWKKSDYLNKNIINK